MSYHKLTKKIKKLEKKNKDFSILAISKYTVICSDKGQLYMKGNIIKIPKIYKYLESIKDDKVSKKELLKIMEG